MGNVDKLLYEIDGVPVIVHAVAAFNKSRYIDEIIVPARNKDIPFLKELFRQYKLDKVKKVIPGGETRMHSVRNGIRETAPGNCLIAIHDAARPLVSQELIEKAVKAGRDYSAVAPGIPINDTIKSVSYRIVNRTLDRDSTFAIQTPQVFDKKLITIALDHAIKTNTPVTDDCAAVENIGMKVFLVDGDFRNIKLTTQTDLRLLKEFWELRQ